MLFASDKLQCCHKLRQSVPIHLSAVHEYGKGYVLGYIEHRDEVIELIDKPDLTAAKYGKLLFILRINIAAVHVHLSACRPIDAAQNVKQGRFARTRRAYDRQKLTLAYREGYIVQRLDHVIIIAVCFAKVFNPEYFHSFLLLIVDYGSIMRCQCDTAVTPL